MTDYHERIECKLRISQKFNHSKESYSSCVSLIDLLPDRSSELILYSSSSQKGQMRSSRNILY